MAGPEVPTPVRATVRDLLADLLGQQVRVGAVAQASESLPSEGAVAAAYIRDDGTPAAVCVCDLPLARSTGAALGGMAPAEAAEAAGEGGLDGDLEEFFAEVVNVMAKLLNTPATPHVRLDGVHRLPAELPAALASVILSPVARADYEVTVDGYGGGCLSILTR